MPNPKINYSIIANEDEVVNNIANYGRGFHIFQCNSTGVSWHSPFSILMQKQISGSDISWSQHITLVMIANGAISIKYGHGNTHNIDWSAWQNVAVATT